ncbi:MAG: aromatic ring-hydroxylating dioxygenase subunit alpha [Planctomycetia bacterium]|nr:aromatic ring-hydroxylating dioxygenase subunit alpha [Planctomycetia bacterium]
MSEQPLEVPESRAWPQEGSTTRVPYWIYSDPEIYKREMERIFRGPVWCYVGLDAEIPKPGDYKTTWIGDRPVIVVRDEDSSINVVENRCAHRGARLCWAPRGNSSEFKCPYHHWSYTLKGELSGMPFRRGVGGKGGMPKDFDLAANGLRRLRVHNEGGLLFASFSADVEPFDRYCGSEVLSYVQREFSGRPLKVLGYNRQIITANWKLYFENLKDPYHATLLHAFFVTFGLWRADAESACVSSEDGKHGVMISRNRDRAGVDETSTLSSFHSELVLEDKDTVTPRREFADGKVVGITLFPCVVLQQQANTLATRHLIPISPSQVELTWTFFGYADDDEAMTRLRLRHANLMGPAGYVSMDDSEVLNQTQIGATACPDDRAVLEMGGKTADNCDHMVSETLIRAFYNYYRTVMGL